MSGINQNTLENTIGISDEEKKKGKIPVRQHLYNLGANYGLKESDIDNIIKYDNATGEIKLGGLNYGKPSVVIDGVSYDDESKIKSAWKNYAQQMGLRENGKTPVREYLYTLGSNYGMKKEDIDNIIKYDNATGEIFLGGMNIGKPSSVVSGVSYDDEANIRTAMENYAERAGLKKRPNDLYHSLIEGNADKLQQQWDENTKHYDSTRKIILDKFTEFGGNITDDQDFKTIAKSVYDKFDYDALVARDNAIAGGAADNGGNIDSYAAANAIRQQAALRNQGINAAVNAGLGVVGQKRADQISMLDKLTGEDQAYFDRQSDNIHTGMYQAQQAFDNDETKLNNQVDRDVKLTGASGHNTGLVKYANNELFNQDGTLKSVNKDYKADYNAFKELLDAATDAEDIKAIKNTMNSIAEAHNWKVLNIPEYSGYQLLPTFREKSLDLLLGESAERISNAQADAEIGKSMMDNQTKYDVAVMDNQTKYDIATMDNQTKLNVADRDNATKRYVSDSSNASDRAIARENNEYDYAIAHENNEYDWNINERKLQNDYSRDMLKYSYEENSDSNGTEKETKKSNTDSWLSKWLYSPWAIPTTEEQINNPESAGIFYKSWGAKTDDIYAARDKLDSKDGYAFCKQELLDAGFTNDQANKKIKEWKKNIAGLEAKRKGITTEEVLENWNWMIDDEVV